MARIERINTINASVKKVFAYLSDPMNELEWLSGMMEVKDVTGKGVGGHYRFVCRLIGLSQVGESTCTEYIPNERIVTQSKGGIVSTWTWTFKSQNRGTELFVVIDYTIPIPVLGKVLEAVALKWMERETDMAGDNIKARMSGGVLLAC